MTSSWDNRKLCSLSGAVFWLSWNKSYKKLIIHVVYIETCFFVSTQNTNPFLKINFNLKPCARKNVLMGLISTDFFFSKCRLPLAFRNEVYQLLCTDIKPWICIISYYTNPRSDMSLLYYFMHAVISDQTAMYLIWNVSQSVSIRGAFYSFECVLRFGRWWSPYVVLYMISC